MNRSPGKADATYQTHTAQHDPYSNVTYSVGFRHTFDSLGQELSGDADYALFHDHSRTELVNTGFAGVPPVRAGDVLSQVNHQPSQILIRTGKLDYSLPLDTGLKLEAGVKGSWVKTQNDFTYDSLLNGVRARPLRENNFLYRERILAAYASGTFKWARYTLQAGLRVENTSSVGDLVSQAVVNSRSYTDVFPNFSFVDKFSDAHQLALSVTRRINRPDYDNLKPLCVFFK